MEKISCPELMKKLRSFEDRQNFGRELGKITLFIFSLYFA